jgi:hypothetical protein
LQFHTGRLSPESLAKGSFPRRVGGTSIRILSETDQKSIGGRKFKKLSDIVKWNDYWVQPAKSNTRFNTWFSYMVCTTMIRESTHFYRTSTLYPESKLSPHLACHPESHLPQNAPVLRVLGQLG